MNHCNIGTRLKINGLPKYKVVRTVKLDLHIHLLFQVCRYHQMYYAKIGIFKHLEIRGSFF